MSGHNGAATRFRPGQSGNPGGRPKVVGEIQDLARVHSVKAIEALAAIVEDKKVSPAARVAAATAILDRAYGRPAQFVATSHTEKPASALSDEELMAIASSGF